MRKNIFAHTDTGASNPGYISVNEEDDGRITVALRSNGAQVPSVIELSRDELANLAANAGAYLEATAPVAPEVETKGKK